MCPNTTKFYLLYRTLLFRATPNHPQVHNSFLKHVKKDAQNPEGYVARTTKFCTVSLSVEFHSFDPSGAYSVDVAARFLRICVPLIIIIPRYDTGTYYES
jgi:hypothetical protein